MEVIVGTSGWSIDIDSGHCIHRSGLEAYFDPATTASGAIRCVGPFGPTAQLGWRDVTACLMQIVDDLEEFPRFSDSYVVWGAYLRGSISDSYPEIRILGERCGWVPNLPLRTELVLRAGEHAAGGLLEREWSLLDDAVSHRAGLAIGYGPLWGKPDPRVVLGDGLDRDLVPKGFEEFVVGAFASTGERISCNCARSFCTSYRYF